MQRRVYRAESLALALREAAHQLWALTLGSPGRPFEGSALRSYAAWRLEVFGRRPSFAELVEFLVWAGEQRRSWRWR